MNYPEDTWTIEETSDGQWWWEVSVRDDYAHGVEPTRNQALRAIANARDWLSDQRNEHLTR